MANTFTWCAQRTLHQHQLFVSQVSQSAGSTRANSAVCLVALKPPPCSEQTPCDPQVHSFTVLSLGELASRGEQAGSSSDTAASDPHRLWSSVPFKRKRAALWGQNFTFPMTWCALRNLLVSAVNTAIAK